MNTTPTPHTRQMMANALEAAGLEATDELTDELARIVKSETDLSTVVVRLGDGDVQFMDVLQHMEHYGALDVTFLNASDQLAMLTLGNIRWGRNDAGFECLEGDVLEPATCVATGLVHTIDVADLVCIEVP